VSPIFGMAETKEEGLTKTRIKSTAEQAWTRPAGALGANFSPSARFLGFLELPESELPLRPPRVLIARRRGAP
jgi:hypothetical protein